MGYYRVEYGIIKDKIYKSLIRGDPVILNDWEKGVNTCLNILKLLDGYATYHIYTRLYDRDDMVVFEKSRERTK